MVTVKVSAVTLYILCACIMLSGVRGQHTCKQLDSCRCQYSDDGSIVDLTSVGNSDGTPRFKDVPSMDGYLYSYNPCKPFDEGICKDAAVCKKDRITGQTLLAGHSDMPQFSYDEMTGDTVIVYTAGDLGELHSIVYLMCDDSDHPGPPQFFPNGTMDTNLFLLTMYSACACGGRCDADGLIGSGSSTIGVGYYISFGIIGVALLYFVIGTVIMKFVKKESGRHIIPNSNFWCGTFINVKNGFRFLISKCGVSVKYEEM